MGKAGERAVFVIGAKLKDVRLDKVIREKYPAWGRQAVSRLLQNRQVRVNGKTVWMGSWKVNQGDEIEILQPPQSKTPKVAHFDPSWLVADEGDLIVVSKPAGLLSQATQAGGEDNLLSLAQQYYSSEVRLFHRLDRDTSGLCLLTRPGPVNAYLDAAFKQRLVQKEYLALVSDPGRLDKEGQLLLYLAEHDKRRDMMQVVERGGQFSMTDYRLVGEFGPGRLVWLRPHTGRTHQLRVHLAYMEAPIIGDRLYGGSKAERLMLHAERIALPEMGDFPAREWVNRAEFSPPG